MKGKRKENENDHQGEERTGMDKKNLHQKRQCHEKSIISGGKRLKNENNEEVRQTINRHRYMSVYLHHNNEAGIHRRREEKQWACVFQRQTLQYTCSKPL